MAGSMLVVMIVATPAAHAAPCSKIERRDILAEKYSGRFAITSLIFLIAPHNNTVTYENSCKL